MDFVHTEDRRMLADSLRRYLHDQYPAELRNEVAYTAPYHAPDKYQELAELGILSALVTPEHGGFGGAGFDISVVFEELGRNLCAEPLLPALLGLKLAQHFAQTELINAVVCGTSKIALAVFEPGNGDDLSALTTTATNVGGSWQLHGQKSVVYGAPQADQLLVAARTDAGIGLFLTDAGQVEGYAMADGGGAGEVRFDNAAATCWASEASQEIAAALDVGRLALCAEAVGAMDVLHSMTVDYLKQRQQFGQPIAIFQALQHRIVDMAIEIEQSRSITILAASKIGTEEQAEYAAMAKNLIGRAATLVAEEATQLHGGIGMTWEYAGAHYCKRLIMLDHQLGDRLQQLHRLLEVA